MKMCNLISKKTTKYCITLNIEKKINSCVIIERLCSINQTKLKNIPVKCCKSTFCLKLTRDKE